jgi:hypothetical protein
LRYRSSWTNYGEKHVGLIQRYVPKSPDGTPPIRGIDIL